MTTAGQPRIVDERLVAFVKARLAEEETEADAAAGHLADGGERGFDFNDLPEPVCRFISTYTPARALADIGAKHRRLENYQRAAWACQRARPDEANSLAGYRDAAWGAVLADASVWANHPEYAPAWKLDS